jgi:hypothetical protein
MPEHDVAHAALAAALDDLLKRRDKRFRAVQAEALCAGVFDVDELLEAFRLDQLVQDGPLAARREVDVLVGTLDAFLNPGFLLGFGDVHEFHAECGAIGRRNISSICRTLANSIPSTLSMKIVRS